MFLDCIFLLVFDLASFLQKYEGIDSWQVLNSLVSFFISSASGKFHSIPSSPIAFPKQCPDTVKALLLMGNLAHPRGWEMQRQQWVSLCLHAQYQGPEALMVESPGHTVYPLFFPVNFPVHSAGPSLSPQVGRGQRRVSFAVRWDETTFPLVRGQGGQAHPEQL